MKAVNQLREEDGHNFKMHYSRLPFFLRQGEETVRSWLVDDLGLPRDTPRGDAMKKAFGGQRVLDQMDKLMKQAGVGPAFWDSQFADTMDSHRLAWYAATESADKGELMWRALSRRYFEGKDTEIQPIRLDSHEMLMECARGVGLDLDQSRRVLESTLYQDEILECVRQMHAVGINSIPVLVFEVDGMAQGSWLENPACKCRKIHHGSGNTEEFKTILRSLDKACSSANM
jgi:predicted DsbA family dithiol-disulfide isomerase